MEKKITYKMIARQSTKDLQVLINDPRITEEEAEMIDNELDARYQESYERQGGMGGYC